MGFLVPYELSAVGVFVSSCSEIPSEPEISSEIKGACLRGKGGYIIAGILCLTGGIASIAGAIMQVGACANKLDERRDDAATELTALAKPVSAPEGLQQ